MKKDRQFLTREVKITSELGLHARPAARIAQMAREAGSHVFICKGKTRVDASDIMDILTLAATEGSLLTICVSDVSDLDVLETIAAYFQNGFSS